MGFSGNEDDYFGNDMPECILDGITLPVSSRRISGGRAIVARKYPNRDGQSSEDLGREPYTIELEIPLFADVHVNHYPRLWDELRAKLDDPPDELEFQDHELGTLRVSIKAPWTSDMVATKRDGVVVHLILEEDSLDTVSSTTTRSGRDDNTAATQTPEHSGANVDHELETTGVTTDRILRAFTAAGVLSTLTQEARSSTFVPGTLFQTIGASFSTFLNGVGVRTADDVAAQVDVLRAQVDVLVSLPELQDPQFASVTTNAMLFLSACAYAASVAVYDAPAMVEEVLLATQSVFEVAARLYDDATRSEQIMNLNSGRGIDWLFIPAGTRLQVLSA